MKVQKARALHILRSNFMQKRKECTKQANIRQMFNTACKSHTDSLIISKGAEVYLEKTVTKILIVRKLRAD
jgi:hypothetical protein